MSIRELLTKDSLTRDSLILGFLFLMPTAFFWPHHTDTAAHTPWLGPPGTRWAGTEANGMQQWGGYFSNVGVRGEYFELRCTRWPFLKTRTADYWPGADWHGYTEWRANKVVYVPDIEKPSPKRKPVSIAAPWWLRWCPA